MKITIRKLGVIEEANIDLRPLTIFIGPNNTGKTWLVYTIAGVLGPYGFSRYREAYIKDNTKEKYPPIENAVQQLLDEGNAKIDLVQFAEEYSEKYFNDVALLARGWMQNFLGTEKADFENLNICLSLTSTKEYLKRRILNAVLDNNRAVGRGRRKPLLTAQKETGKNELYIYTSSEEEDVAEKLPKRAIVEFVAHSVFQLLHLSLYPYMYTFPAERIDLILASITKVEQEVSETSELFSQERRTRPSPWYIGSFVGMMIELLETGSSDREQDALTDEKVRTYMNLAEELTEQVLNGRLDFSTSEPDPRREILFKTGAETVLDMSAVSSMVKGISTLVLYLRYLAQEDELLIIDEPEMNLHPEAQAKIIEFLAMLVNAGLNVLFTTHSPYITDHLANLIKASESDDQDTISKEFYLKRKEAFITREKVSVYGVDKGEVKDILDEDGIINWNTFGRVSERISEIYFKL